MGKDSGGKQISCCSHSPALLWAPSVCLLERKGGNVIIHTHKKKPKNEGGEVRGHFPLFVLVTEIIESLFHLVIRIMGPGVRLPRFVDQLHHVPAV